MDNLELERAVQFAQDSLRQQNDARLTKREEFAKAAMQGLCASLNAYGPGRFINVDELANDAVVIADRTMKELADNEPPVWP